MGRIREEIPNPHEKKISRKNFQKKAKNQYIM
jgi:hypothetical protein